MANEEVRKKLQALAGKVQGRITTHSEDLRIDESLSRKVVRSRDDVKEVLAEALNKSTRDVGTVLASDDSDRIADEIISLLKK